jgi:hypothetical protein
LEEPDPLIDVQEATVSAANVQAKELTTSKENFDLCSVRASRRVLTNHSLDIIEKHFFQARTPGAFQSLFCYKDPLRFAFRIGIATNATVII